MDVVKMLFGNRIGSYSLFINEIQQGWDVYWCILQAKQYPS